MMRRILILLSALALLALPLSASQVTAADLLSAGRVDDALKILKSRLQSQPGDAETYHLLCRTYFAEQRWDDAISAGERAVALNPNNSDYHMWLGRAYGEKAGSSSFITAASLTKKVRAEFERAVELDAGNVLARTDLAEFYLSAPGFLGGGKQKAIAQAEQLAARDAAGAHWVQAAVAEKEKDYQTHSFLKWFVDEQVEEVDSQVHLSQIARMAGDHLLAIEAYIAHTMK